MVTLNVFQRYRLLGLLASLKLALVLLAIFGASIAVATFVEARRVLAELGVRILAIEELPATAPRRLALSSTTPAGSRSWWACWS